MTQIKSVIYITTIIALLSCNLFAQEKAKLSASERILIADNQEYFYLRNPQTGEIPHYLVNEIIQSQKKTRSAGVNDTWIEVGPTNRPGRVNEILFTGTNTALIACAGGGLWQSNDLWNTDPLKVSWLPKFDKLSQTVSNQLYDGMHISTICKHPSNATILYFGTGDRNNGKHIVNSSMNYKGRGIWKSTDAGSTWSLLTNTVPTSATDKFATISKMLVDAQGFVYVATIGSGLYKSSTANPTSITTWTKILGSTVTTTPVSSDFITDMELNSNNELIVASAVWGGTSTTSLVGIWKLTSNGTVVSKITDFTSFISNSSGTYATTEKPINIEISLGNNNTHIYAFITKPSTVSGKVAEIHKILKTTNANAATPTWSACTLPIDAECTSTNTSDFTNGQGDYNLCSAVDPSNPLRIYTGGLNIHYSIDGGATWSRRNSSGGSNQPHVDQHCIAFAPNTSGLKVLVGNDGGVSRTLTGTSTAPISTSTNKNFFGINSMLRTNQFYSVATSNTNSNTTFAVIGGSQDNGTSKMTKTAMSAGSEILGGDGGYCFISTLNNSNVIASTQNGDFRKSINAGTNWSTVGTNSGTFTGDFISYADFSNNDVLYSLPITTNSIIRRAAVFGTPVETLLQGANLSGTSGLNNSKITCVTVSPNDPTTIYVGTSNGRIVRITNANTCLATVPSANIKYMNTGSLPSGVISSIAVKKTTANTDDEIVAVYSSYGVTNRIWRTTNGTATTVTWTNVTGTYQDLPIWSVVFAPDANTASIKLLLGTELGVWTTDAFSGATTSWVRFDNGMPNTRVTMLKLNPIDNNYYASTFGRGIYRTDIFSTVKVNFKATLPSKCQGPCPIALTNLSTSSSPMTYEWDFNDDGTPDATTQNPTINPCVITPTYIRLTVNGLYSIVKHVSELQTIDNTCACSPCGGGSGGTSASTTAGTTNNKTTWIETITLDNNFNIYPNPTNGIVKIKSNEKIDWFELYDIHGKLIKKVSNFQETEIDLSNYSTGMYLYKYSVQSKIQNGKIIKE